MATRLRVLVCAVAGAFVTSCQDFSQPDATITASGTSPATSASSGTGPSSGATAPTTSGSTSGTTDAEPTTTADLSTTASSAVSSSETSSSGAIPDLPGQCLGATEPCTDASECCADAGLTCSTTTLGMVCCGLEGAACGTPNGEDCCGDQLCVGGTCIAPDTVPHFQAPYPCGQSWTYSHHDAEVRRALDFIDNGGNTDGAPAIAALAGVATRHYQEGGAGNYIVIDHWGGWQTYYFHLQAFSVEDGTYVQQGQEVGLVGSTGASSGPHMHFEELRNGEGKDIWLNGQLLAPYPGEYFQQSHTSANCP
ncbi:M23 family metallopeptidase [Nannocystis sp. SCPEA4]|uniref:M23 family metallopeptidase n=1 Tax=Nannocystis sp. SCPEA4 TaxID=2996787 RepID=UPI00227091FF|nr:M23 family metallopeptidase [Nannocystis sp. SCPEA4]MCY1061153.1 M23 family metallopeptidase [Nannocystis sp. SCPEA4]